MNLYELTQDFKEISELDFSELEEQQIEAIKATILSEIENKGTGIIAVVRNLESDIDSIKGEIARLQELKRAKENKIENIKKYTKECLEGADIKKVATSLGNISLRKSAGAVEVLDESIIPDEYKVEKVEVKLDKKSILADLKEGVIIDGVTLKTGNSLVIK